RFCMIGPYTSRRCGTSPRGGRWRGHVTPSFFSATRYSMTVLTQKDVIAQARYPPPSRRQKLPLPFAPAGLRSYPREAGLPSQDAALPLANFPPLLASFRGVLGRALRKLARGHRKPVRAGRKLGRAGPKLARA